MTPRKLRIGAPRHLCIRPLIFGLTRSPDNTVELIFAESSRLAVMLDDGGIDAALIPGIEYLRGVGGYFLMGPALIAADTPGGIILVSQTPVEEIKRIAVDEHCRTPIAALRITLDAVHGVLPDICVAKNADKDWQSRFDAMLLSGDKALQYLNSNRAQQDIIADVGSMWYELTSKPLVLSLWAFNDSSLEKRLGKILLASRNLGITNLSLLADGISQTSPYGSEFLYKHLNEVWNYDLRDIEVEGLKLLEEYAYKYKLIHSRRLGENVLAMKE